MSTDPWKTHTSFFFDAKVRILGCTIGGRVVLFLKALNCGLKHLSQDENELVVWMPWALFDHYAKMENSQSNMNMDVVYTYNYLYQFVCVYNIFKYIHVFMHHSFKMSIWFVYVLSILWALWSFGRWFFLFKHNVFRFHVNFPGCFHISFISHGYFWKVVPSEVASKLTWWIQISRDFKEVPPLEIIKTSLKKGGNKNPSYDLSLYTSDA